MNTINGKQKMITGELSLQEMINGMTTTKRFILLASLMFLTTVSCAQLRPLLKGVAIKGFLSLVFMSGIFISAMAQQATPELPVRKRFIDKVEVFAGPNLSFNYGNMFIENYRGEYADDNYVINKRLLKPGYAFGAGAYHSFTERISLNVRLLYEQKGTRNELNTPSNPVNSDARQRILQDYTYKYLTLNIAPQLFVDPHKRVSLSLGFYYSKIKSLTGCTSVYDSRYGKIDEGYFEGRFFYDLRDDGAIYSVTWTSYLNGIEDNDFGIVLSMGYEIPISDRHTILVQLQDNLGINNINKDSPYQAEKNHSIVFIVSYNFNLPSKQ